MDIYFTSKSLERKCSEERRRVREWGPEGAKKILLRLQQLQAAGTLEDMRSLPGRVHVLSGDRAGQLAIDVHHPRRLVFQPTVQPPPEMDSGRLDWAAVESVTILEIVDYH